MYLVCIFLLNNLYYTNIVYKFDLNLKLMVMNKSLQMYFYNKLRQANPKISKSKEGRSALMDEAVLTSEMYSCGHVITFSENLKDCKTIIPFTVTKLVYGVCNTTYEQIGIVQNNNKIRLFFNTNENVKD